MTYTTQTSGRAKKLTSGKNGSLCSGSPAATGQSLNVLYERHGFSRATQTATNEGFKGCGKTGFRVGPGFIPGTVQSNLQPLGPEVRF